MSKKAWCLIILLLMVGCGEKPQQPTAAKPKVDADPKRARFQEAIDKTTPEGKDMVEKVKVMKPEVNEKVAAKPLGEIIDDYATNKGEFNIKPLGWTASQKATKNWKVAYYYQDYLGQYNAAEWEYNPETKKLYPFEFTNAPTFWTDIGPAGAANSNAKGAAPAKTDKK
jgi:hypothetical protein